MKFFVSSITLSIVFIVSAYAQTRKLETIPFTNADNEEAYLDLLAKALGDEPSSRGILIGYRKSDSSPGAFLRHIYGYQDYLVNKRGIDRNRIQIIEGDVKPETFTQVWLVPVGAQPPVADSQFYLVPTLPLKFDVVLPDCPSEFTLDLEELDDYLRFYSRALLANPNVSAKIVAYPGRQSTIRTVGHIAAKGRGQLISNYGIAGKRIATITDSRRRRRECSQIELWLTRRR
jgi:hypothetical protein